MATHEYARSHRTWVIVRHGRTSDTRTGITIKYPADCTARLWIVRPVTAVVIATPRATTQATGSGYRRSRWGSSNQPATEIAIVDALRASAVDVSVPWRPSKAIASNATAAAITMNPTRLELRVRRR